MVRARWNMLVMIENIERYGRAYVYQGWKGPVRSRGKNNAQVWCTRPLTSSERVILLKLLHCTTLLAMNMGSLKMSLSAR